MSTQEQSQLEQETAVGGVCHASDHNMTNAQWLQERLAHAFPDSVIHVHDSRGDDQHMAVFIQSSAFHDQTRMSSHRMVYDALDHMRSGQIHALSIKTQSTQQE